MICNALSRSSTKAGWPNGKASDYEAYLAKHVNQEILGSSPRLVIPFLFLFLLPEWISGDKVAACAQRRVVKLDEGERRDAVDAALAEYRAQERETGRSIHEATMKARSLRSNLCPCTTMVSLNRPSATQVPGLHPVRPHLSDVCIEERTVLPHSPLAQSRRWNICTFLFHHNAI